MGESAATETIIVGTGFGGLCAGSFLRRAGRDDLILLEKAEEVGGTWRENTYPGAECDVPSALYSYSFAPNPTWDFKWAKQAQILSYLKRFADAEGLRERTRFGQAVERARWDGERWHVATRDGSYRCRHLILAVGQLHHPAVPQVEGRDDFAGPAFHSARWDHSAALRGRRVAVLGSAASAVQLVPEVAAVARRLTVYQRSPNWVLPKGDRPYSRAEHALGRLVPGYARAYRAGLWAMGEYGLYPMIRGAPLRRRLGEWLCKRSIREHVTDPGLRARLVPDYPIGAKRILLSDRYYPALAREDVDLVTDPVERFTRGGIVAGGQERPHDAVVFATGFRTNPFVEGIEVRGERGRTLREHWRDGAHAYLGVQTAGFPNLFLMYGPNTNTGHTSIVYKHEAQAGLIVRLIEAAGEGAVGVRARAEDAFNEEVRERLDRLAWARVEASWYKHGDRITNNWPGSAREYRRRLARDDLSAFELSG